jgi:signal transduction histidine kinase
MICYRAHILLAKTILIFLFCHDDAVAQNTWKEVKDNNKGTITIYWDSSKPFIYKDNSGNMAGIEADIMDDFREYLEDVHHVDLKLNWEEAKSFSNTYMLIRDRKQPGTFGASAFSITQSRQQEVDFSPPYMSDISVLITSKNVPIVRNLEEFNLVFSRLTAITIKQTTYEQQLLKIQEEGNLPFDIHYIPSSANVLRTIESMDDAFGFIDLPVYMMLFNNDPSIKVKRQNLFPVKREGYAFIFPENSDWNTILVEYFNSAKFKSRLEKIISNYIDVELYHFVENLADQSNNQVSLLTKEKEIQQKDLLAKANQIEQEGRTRNFLIALATIIFISLIIIIMLYQKQNEQKKKIETQGKSIETKSQQLEKRNDRLIALNEEKNNLVKILAHDLRTPINHIVGLVQVLLVKNNDLPDDQKLLIQQVIEASLRLNKMISNILDVDAIENDRVKIFIDDVTISPLIKQVVSTFEQPAANKNISLTYVTTCPDSVIKGDSLFLIQVFENLISNAIKFSEKGKSVVVKIESINDEVQIRVTDNGPGLTDDDLRILFKKFQRLSAKATGGEPSTGLGLSIVKRYVELMDGKVWCESQPGKETSFIVSFSKINNE